MTKGEQTRQPDGAPEGIAWRRWLIGGAVLIVLLLVAWLVGRAVLPRWWAQRIADQVDGSMVAGTGIGLAYGFAFTGLALAALWPAFRRRRSWKVRAMLGALATVLAVPNLLTLSIVVGTGDAAHAGDRILDVDGPNFRWATLVGVALAVLLVGGLKVLVAIRGHSDDPDGAGDET